MTWVALVVVGVGDCLLDLDWTFAVSVPLHVKVELEQGGTVTLQRLVATNWVRTALWTLVFLVGLTT